MPVLIGAVGVSIDYAMAAKARAQLSAAADAAVLSGTSTSALTNFSELPDAGKSKVQDFFMSQVQALGNVTVTSLNLTMNETGGRLFAQIDCAATIPNMFGGIIGLAKSTINCHAQSATNTPKYIDFYLLLDNSPSMGLAATSYGQQVMNDNIGCAFACHQVGGDGSGGFYDNYTYAKSLGVETKLDTMRDAVQQLTLTANSPVYKTVANQYRMGLFTFSDSFAKLQDITSDLTAVSTAANGIDLVYAYTPVIGQQTSYDAAVPAMDAAMTTAGDGTSSSQPEKFLFFVTDGIEDENSALYNKVSNTGPSPRVIDLLTPSMCDSIKAKNISIAVLYTVYLPVTSNDYYNTMVAPLNPQTGANPLVNSLQACASPGFFFSVTPTLGIPDAMTAMFKAAIRNSTLTQ